jgi:hypothetical protein
VAFVDILGFRDIVARMQKEKELFSTVRDALKTIDKQAREFRDYRVERKQSHEAILARGKAPLTDPPHLQMTAFSNRYVISETFPAWHVLAGVQALVPPSGYSLLREVEQREADIERLNEEARSLNTSERN